MISIYIMSIIVSSSSIIIIIIISSSSSSMFVTTIITGISMIGISIHMIIISISIGLIWSTQVRAFDDRA